MFLFHKDYKGIVLLNMTFELTARCRVFALIGVSREYGNILHDDSIGIIFPYSLLNTNP